MIKDLRRPFVLFHVALFAVQTSSAANYALNSRKPVTLSLFQAGRVAESERYYSKVYHNSSSADLDCGELGSSSTYIQPPRVEMKTHGNAL